jgi:hypothetical protein
MFPKFPQNKKHKKMNLIGNNGNFKPIVETEDFINKIDDIIFNVLGALRNQNEPLPESNTNFTCLQNRFLNMFCK